ncbi:tetraspanin-4-like [Porites lutea]|uniref:tetraspanin-4-like n=1 Tax=Porites lutea TaxID=51062 RepID=UPI003CC569C0
MEGAAKIIKFLVVFFNFIFFVFGIVLIGVGAWTLIKFGDYVTLTDSIPYATGSKVTIAAGCLIALISFMGCCGAWKENRCMLVIFFICLLVILALEIAGAALAYKYRGDFDKELDEGVVKEMREHYGEDGSEGTTKAWDTLQREEKCCGWNNYTEWYRAKIFNGKSYVPDSCCNDEKKDCGQNPPKNIYTAPCKGKLEKLIKDKLYYVGAVGITIVIIQVLGMIFALVLICKIGKDGTYA